MWAYVESCNSSPEFAQGNWHVYSYVTHAYEVQPSVNVCGVVEQLQEMGAQPFENPASAWPAPPPQPANRTDLHAVPKIEAQIAPPPLFVEIVPSEPKGERTRPSSVSPRTFGSRTSSSSSVKKAEVFVDADGQRRPSSASGRKFSSRTPSSSSVKNAEVMVETSKVSFPAKEEKGIEAHGDESAVATPLPLAIDTTFQTPDTNHDGIIDDSEFSEYLSALQQYQVGASRVRVEGVVLYSSNSKSAMVAKTAAESNSTQEGNGVYSQPYNGINGEYARSEQICNGRSVYIKVKTPTTAMWWANNNGKISWCVGPLEKMGTKDMWAYVGSMGFGPEEAGSRAWTVYQYKSLSWEDQTGVVVASLDPMQKDSDEREAKERQEQEAPVPSSVWKQEERRAEEEKQEQEHKSLMDMGNKKTSAAPTPPLPTTASSQERIPTSASTTSSKPPDPPLRTSSSKPPETPVQTPPTSAAKSLSPPKSRPVPPATANKTGGSSGRSKSVVAGKPLLEKTKKTRQEMADALMEVEISTHHRPFQNSV
jgi:hypothetical protein